MEESKAAVAVYKRIHASLTHASGDLGRAAASKKRKADSEVEKLAKAEEKKRLSDAKKMQKSLDKMTSSNSRDHIFFHPAGENLHLFTKLPVVRSRSWTLAAPTCECRVRRWQLSKTL